MNFQGELIDMVAEMMDVPRDSIDPHEPLYNLGLDSMRLVEIMVFIETRYGLDLMENNLRQEEIATLSAMAQTIGRKLQS